MITRRGLARALILGYLIATPAVAEEVDQAHTAFIAKLEQRQFQLPPGNDYLADSAYPVTHANPAQTAAFNVSGPVDRSRQLRADEIEYNDLGPANLIFVISGPYANGERAAWSVAANGISKQNYSRFTPVDTLVTRKKPYTEEWAEEMAESLAEPDGLAALWSAVRLMGTLAESSNLYTLIDNNNEFYVGEQSGAIAVYGDKRPGDIDSAIEVKRRFKLPPEATGEMVGMNLAFDGTLLALTEDGYLLAIARDFSSHQIIRLNGAPAETSRDEGAALSGWISNSFAVDENAIYIVSDDFMHRVMWDGRELSQSETDGAWVSAYPKDRKVGSGSTPSLMGFDSSEDKFVVITDGSTVMNMTLFWREDIPADWQALPGNLPRRIAGSAPVDMGREDPPGIQSHQSVLVSGYGALAVNNEPPEVPWFFPHSMRPILVGVLATEEKYRPTGMQKFEWDSRERKLTSVWVNSTVSSPNSVPMMSTVSNQVYTVGTREGQWTLEAVDWVSGQSTFHYRIGGPRYNSIYAPIVLDDDGRISYGSPFGRVRLNPGL